MDSLVTNDGILEEKMAIQACRVALNVVTPESGYPKQPPSRILRALPVAGLLLTDAE